MCRRKQTHDICNDQWGQKGQTKKLNYLLACLPALHPPLHFVQPGLATHHTVSAAPCPLRPSEKGTAAASEIIKLLRPTTRVSLQKLRERTTKAKSLPWAISGRPVAIIRLLVSRTTYYLSLAPSLPFPLPAAAPPVVLSVLSPVLSHSHSAAITTDRPANRSVALLDYRLTHSAHCNAVPLTRQVAHTARASAARAMH